MPACESSVLLQQLKFTETSSAHACQSVSAAKKLRINQWDLRAPVCGYQMTRVRRWLVPTEAWSWHTRPVLSGSVGQWWSFTLLTSEEKNICPTAMRPCEQDERDTSRVFKGGSVGGGSKHQPCQKLTRKERKAARMALENGGEISNKFSRVRDPRPHTHVCTGCSSAGTQFVPTGDGHYQFFHHRRT